jgi:hypothetical protein
MNNRNYKLAISLAEPVKHEFDLDIIYKRQWEDLKQSHAIEEEHLEVLVEYYFLIPISQFLAMCS